MTNKRDYGDVRFMHFKDGVRVNPLLGGATVAYKKQEDDTLLYALALTHPKDRFTKEYGRAKSYGKLQQLLAKPSLAGTKNNAYMVVQGVATDTAVIISRMADESYFLRGLDVQPAYVGFEDMITNSMSAL